VNDAAELCAPPSLQATFLGADGALVACGSDCERPSARCCTAPPQAPASKPPPSRALQLAPRPAPCGAAS
jgi:hypothetical protein